VGGAGIRVQLFIALAISIVVGAVTAGVAGYHVFQRGVVSAFEARLGLVVDEVARVLDAGIMAGLGIEDPQLLRRALASSSAAREGLFDAEILAVLDGQGRTVSSTISAEIGEQAPAAWMAVASDSGGDDSFEAADSIVVTRRIASLFNTTEGVVVARLPMSVVVPRQEALLYRLAILGTGVVVVLIALAAALVWLVPWPVTRQLEALQETMAGLYEDVGDSPGHPSKEHLPRALAAVFPPFRDDVLRLKTRLHEEAGALNRLDEAA